MHNADWDGIKAVPIAFGLSGLILITINLPLLGALIGGILLGAFAIVWLYNYFRERYILRQWMKIKVARHENTLTPISDERAPSYEVIGRMKIKPINTIATPHKSERTIIEGLNDTDSSNV